MSGIGEQIAAAREQRGMTPAEAARRLHIRADFIAAIDSEEWSRLGPPIYARGFVRNYAKLVGVDPKSIAHLLDAAIPAQIPESHGAAGENGTTDNRTTDNRTTDPRLRIDQPTRAATAAHIESSRAAWYPWLLGSMTTLAAGLVVALLYYTFAPAPREQAQPQTQSAQTLSAAPAPQDDALFNGGSAGVVQSNGPASGVDLKLQLTQSSWLSVTVDGKQVVYETLPAGTVRDFHGVREITLRAGNAGGVNAVIDGRPLGTLGQHGQVEERKFAAKAASPSSTGPRE